MATNLTYQIVDLRDEFKAYEQKNRPFPPRSGSVTKAKRSCEPETQWKYARWAEAGKGEPICYVVRF